MRPRSNYWTRRAHPHSQSNRGGFPDPPYFFPNEQRDATSLPSEDPPVRVAAGHGVAVTWYGSTAQAGGRPLPEPTSPEDAFFYLMKMGGSANHVWRLFRTRDEVVEFMVRQFPGGAKASAEALPVARYADLLSRGSG